MSRPEPRWERWREVSRMEYVYGDHSLTSGICYLGIRQGGLVSTEQGSARCFFVDGYQDLGSPNSTSAIAASAATKPAPTVSYTKYPVPFACQSSFPVRQLVIPSKVTMTTFILRRLMDWFLFALAFHHESDHFTLVDVVTTKPSSVLIHRTTQPNKSRHAAQVGKLRSMSYRKYQFNSCLSDARGSILAVATTVLG